MTPALDTSLLPATTADPTIGTFTNGVGTLAFSAGSGFAFTRSTTTPNAPFNADIALALNVIDSDSVVYSEQSGIIRRGYRGQRHCVLHR